MGSPNNSMVMRAWLCGSGVDCASGRNMPLASDGAQLFPVSQTNSYGRVMIAKQMETHDDLVSRAPTIVNDKVDAIYMRQMQILHKAERFRPSYNQMKQRHDDDIVMSNLIRDAKCTCENRLDGHILRFKELRQKHPNFVPGWLKRYEDQKSMEVHEEIIRKARKWIDDEPPSRALHYGSVLKKTPFTRGGFPRIANTMPKARRRKKGRKKRNAANASPEPLPPRRGTASRPGSRIGLNTTSDVQQQGGAFDATQGTQGTQDNGDDFYDDDFEATDT